MSVKIKYMHDTCSETEAVKDMWKLYYEFMKDPPISVGNNGRRIIFKYENSIESLSIEKDLDSFEIKYPEKWKKFLIDSKESFIEFDSEKLFFNNEIEIEFPNKCKFSTARLFDEL